MSATVRLQEMQSALSKRGVRDVKFCFALSDQTPASEVAHDAEDFLQAYLDKARHAVVEGISDAPRA